MVKIFRNSLIFLIFFAFNPELKAGLVELNSEQIVKEAQAIVKNPQKYIHNFVRQAIFVGIDPVDGRIIPNKQESSSCLISDLYRTIQNYQQNVRDKAWQKFNKTRNNPIEGLIDLVNTLNIGILRRFGVFKDQARGRAGFESAYVKRYFKPGNRVPFCLNFISEAYNEIKNGTQDGSQIQNHAIAIVIFNKLLYALWDCVMIQNRQEKKLPGEGIDFRQAPRQHFYKIPEHELISNVFTLDLRGNRKIKPLMDSGLISTIFYRFDERQAGNYLFMDEWQVAEFTKAIFIFTRTVIGQPLPNITQMEPRSSIFVPELSPLQQLPSRLSLKPLTTEGIMPAFSSSSGQLPTQLALLPTLTGSTKLRGGRTLTPGTLTPRIERSSSFLGTQTVLRSQSPILPSRPSLSGQFPNLSVPAPQTPQLFRTTTEVLIPFPPSSQPSSPSSSSSRQRSSSLRQQRPASPNVPTPPAPLPFSSGFNGGFFASSPNISSNSSGPSSSPGASTLSTFSAFSGSSPFFASAPQSSSTSSLSMPSSSSSSSPSGFSIFSPSSSSSSSSTSSSSSSSVRAPLPTPSNFPSHLNKSVFPSISPLPSSTFVPPLAGSSTQTQTRRNLAPRTPTPVEPDVEMTTFTGGQLPLSSSSSMTRKSPTPSPSPSSPSPSAPRTPTPPPPTLINPSVPFNSRLQGSRKGNIAPGNEDDLGGEEMRSFSPPPPSNARSPLALGSSTRSSAFRSFSPLRPSSSVSSSSRNPAAVHRVNLDKNLEQNRRNNAAVVNQAQKQVQQAQNLSSRFSALQQASQRPTPPPFSSQPPITTLTGPEVFTSSSVFSPVVFPQPKRPSANPSSGPRGASSRVPFSSPQVMTEGRGQQPRVEKTDAERMTALEAMVIPKGLIGMKTQQFGDSLGRIITEKNRIEALLKDSPQIPNLRTLLFNNNNDPILANQKIDLFIKQINKRQGLAAELGPLRDQLNNLQKSVPKDENNLKAKGTNQIINELKHQINTRIFNENILKARVLDLGRALIAENNRRKQILANMDRMLGSSASTASGTPDPLKARLDALKKKK